MTITDTNIAAPRRFRPNWWRIGALGFCAGFWIVVGALVAMVLR